MLVYFNSVDPSTQIYQKKNHFSMYDETHIDVKYAQIFWRPQAFTVRFEIDE